MVFSQLEIASGSAASCTRKSKTARLPGSNRRYDDGMAKRVDRFSEVILKAFAKIFGSSLQKSRGINRNGPCPCGSGLKYKRCCLPKEEAAKKKR